jgi:hypothetical protein
MTRSIAFAAALIAILLAANSQAPAAGMVDTGTTADVTCQVHKPGTGQSGVPNITDPTFADTGLIETTAFGTVFSGQATAYAATRNLKAYATMTYDGVSGVNAYSLAYAKYNEQIAVETPDFGWGNYPGADITLSWRLTGTETVDGSFLTDPDWYSNRRVHLTYSPRRGQEPTNVYLEPDADGLVTYLFEDYEGAVLSLEVQLAIEISAYGDGIGSATLDYYSTLAYESLTVSDEDGDPIVVFDAANNVIVGDGAGWSVTPEPATLALLALGSLALVRRRR